MFEQRELSDLFILLNFLVFFKWNDGGSTKGHKKTEKEGGKLIFYSILCICWMEGLYVMSYLVAAVAVRCTYVASSKHVLLFSESIFFPTERLFWDFNQGKTNYFILRHEKKTMNQPKKNKKSESISDSTAHPKRRRWWVKKSNILSVNKYLIWLFYPFLMHRRIE